MATRAETEARIVQLQAELNNPQAGLTGAALAARNGRLQREITEARAELNRPATAPVATIGGTTPITPTTPPPCPSPQPSSGIGWGWFVVVLAILMLIVSMISLGRKESTVQYAPPTPVVKTPPPTTRQPEQQFRSFRDCMFAYGERRELADGRCDHLSR
ncbi:MAG: hypothetical protein WD989_00755 [Candidatus Paceibacterota bacterium]